MRKALISSERSREEAELDENSYIVFVYEKRDNFFLDFFSKKIQPSLALRGKRAEKFETL